MPPQNAAGWSSSNNEEGDYTETIEYIVEIEFIPEPSPSSSIPVALAWPIPIVTPLSIPAPDIIPPNQYTKADPSFTARPIKYPSVYYHLSSYPSVTLPPWTTVPTQATSRKSLNASKIPKIPSSAVATTDSVLPPLETKADSETYWQMQHGAGHNKTGVYVAAIVIPLLLLTVIGALVFFCMRRRRRQREKTTAEEPKPEMNMPWQPQPLSTVQPYVVPVPVPVPAPAPAVLPRCPITHDERFTPPTSVSAQPVILGPIPSGVNGAYLTGIDTSDVVSVTSSGNRRSGVQDPFSDNNSLSEPPPPYRPRSIAPPSFTTNSRQSSVRSSAPPATSRTHLIERSPFDDPIYDDAVSEFSCTATRRDGDTVSTVSDISYQNEPVKPRPSL